MLVSRWSLSVVLLSTVCASHASSQGSSEIRPPRTAIGEIRGRITDSATGRPLSDGSITVRRLGDSLFAGGTLARDDGGFRVDGLGPGAYSVRIRALGYAPLTRSPIVLTAERPAVDVGTLALTVVARRLTEQTIIAERDDQVLAPDRNTYSVRNMATAAGGTAVDVLRNIPAVELDGNNRVNLRGNANVVIQVNGRSTPLAGEQLGAFLAQIPASLIKQIEVATSPSARSDPDGTAGIVNIVLDQRTQLALSGAVTAALSTTSQLNLTGNIGQQRGPLTLFLSATAYHDRRATSGSISRTNLVQPVPAFVETRLDGTQSPRSAGAMLRSEFRLDDRNALSLDGSLFTARYGRDQSSSYADLDTARTVIGLFDQHIDQLSRVASRSVALGFHRRSTSSGTEGHTELDFWDNRNLDDADRSGDVIRADASMPASITSERDRTAARFSYWNLKSDHTKAFGARGKLEAGFRVTSRLTTNDLDATVMAPSGAYVADSVRSRDLDYRESIGAVYGVVTREVGRAQVQAGLRLERAETLLRLPSSGDRYDGGYRSAFPSAVLAYAVTKQRQLRLSYSRRVTRPQPNQLNPTEQRIDTRTLFRGDPTLRPEYTDAGELSLTEARTWGTLQLVPYLRQTRHAVRTILFVDTAGVSVTTYRNVASTLTAGTDLNVTVRRGPLTLLTGGTVHRYSSDAANLAGNPSVRALAWSTRANVTWQFSALADAQVTSSYRAPYATEGGSTLASAAVNAAFRYKVWGDEGSVSLRLSDPFRIVRYGYRTANGSVIELSERYNGARAVFLAVTRNFGRPLRLRPQGESESQGGGGPP
jgi:outer membrane receptor protein involved in Fe transport